MRVRNAKPEDEPFVRELATQVFSVYGDYRELLPKWFKVQGVLTFVSEQDEQRTGFVMLGFFREEQALAGDVLAIAVAPSWQRHGIGRVLLNHALAVCDEAAEHEPVTAVRLSVAHTNDKARALFESCGFALTEGDFGKYAGGQDALHMRRVVRRRG